MKLTEKLLQKMEQKKELYGMVSSCRMGITD